MHRTAPASFVRVLVALFVSVASCPATVQPPRLHAMFTDHMVLQRDVPIVVWGWAEPGSVVVVVLGDERTEAVADGEAGRFEATFAARPASAAPVTLSAAVGSESVVRTDLVVGDVWVAYGQSNMAWSLGKTVQSDVELAQADLPLLRHVRIQNNEQAELQDDIPSDALVEGGWQVSTPATAAGFSAIGYCFCSRLQRALGVPIGIICNARGGASIESLVPAHCFARHPLAKAYQEHVAARVAAFDPRARALEQWQRELQRAKARGVPEARWPKQPVAAENLRSWHIPGKSPSDAASCYNGMFGVFRGLGIKGVVFHQGYNNAIASACRPERYRVLMRLMVEGIRADFADPRLPVIVIGLCAGGVTQHDGNFEELSADAGPFIREAQRLGLADVGDPERTAFVPAYDVRIPGLHPRRKREHGLRAARWALARVYGTDVACSEAALVSAEPSGDELVLTFDRPVMPADQNSVPEGFAIAGDDGRFFRAHARYRVREGQKKFDEAKHYEARVVHLWSPLVEAPVAVRYAWARSPVGNLKVDGHPDTPLASFRTDRWDWPESEDPDVSAMTRGDNRARQAAAAAQGQLRREQEALQAAAVVERVQRLGGRSGG